MNRNENKMNHATPFHHSVKKFIVVSKSGNVINLGGKSAYSGQFAQKMGGITVMRASRRQFGNCNYVFRSKQAL